MRAQVQIRAVVLCRGIQKIGFKVTRRTHECKGYIAFVLATRINICQGSGSLRRASNRKEGQNQGGQHGGGRARMVSKGAQSEASLKYVLGKLVKAS